MTETNYTISSEDQEKISKWLDEVAYPAAVAKQQRENTNPGIFTRILCAINNEPYPQVDPKFEEYWDMSRPYGSTVEYVFTPTGIGDAFHVRESVSGMEINLTDYSKW